MGNQFFTSDLTAREYFLCREAGFHTVGQVMGTSFFNVGFFGTYTGRWGMTGELTDITQSQLKARHLAVSRMKHEARLMGAHGIIGVRIKIHAHDWSSRMTEFTAFGTAIRIPGWTEEESEPFTSDLNGQDFWQLYKAGYRPRGLAFGVCSYYVSTDLATQNILYRRGWLTGAAAPNQEVWLSLSSLCIRRAIWLKAVLSQTQANSTLKGWLVWMSTTHCRTLSTRLTTTRITIYFCTS